MYTSLSLARGDGRGDGRGVPHSIAHGIARVVSYDTRDAVSFARWNLVCARTMLLKSEPNIHVLRTALSM